MSPPLIAPGIRISETSKLRGEVHLALVELILGKTSNSEVQLKIEIGIVFSMKVRKPG
jgi:hypothetical protein